jgi:hypothetical protein
MKYLEESAKRQKADRRTSSDGRDAGLLSAINPFVEPPLPTATPQLSKEYIYAGSRMLAVEDANANAAPPADLAVWRPSTGVWYVLGGQGSQQISFPWGAPSDKPVPGDYDGDGKTDFSVFRPSDGTWYIQRSSDNSSFGYQFGQNGDRPAPADYDGDGRTDAAVYRNGTWYIQRSSQGFLGAAFGGASDIPTPADFDGDGKADLAYWSSTLYRFHIINSSNGQTLEYGFGTLNDTPEVADYDGDGRADLAIRRDDGYWHIAKSSTNYTAMMYFQEPQPLGDTVPNDYDGDGKADIASWQEANGMWSIWQSSRVGQSNYLRQVQWGQAGDFPVPAFYRR